MCLSKLNSASRHDSPVDYLNCFQMNIVLQYINVSVKSLQQSNIIQYLHKAEGYHYCDWCCYPRFFLRFNWLIFFYVGDFNTIITLSLNVYIYFQTWTVVGVACSTRPVDCEISLSHGEIPSTGVRRYRAQPLECAHETDVHHSLCMCIVNGRLMQPPPSAHRSLPLRRWNKMERLNSPVDHTFTFIFLIPLLL